MHCCAMLLKASPFQRGSCEWSNKMYILGSTTVIFLKMQGENEYITKTVQQEGVFWGTESTFFKRSLRLCRDMVYQGLTEWQEKGGGWVDWLVLKINNRARAEEWWVQERIPEQFPVCCCLPIPTDHSSGRSYTPCSRVWSVCFLPTRGDLGMGEQQSKLWSYLSARIYLHQITNNTTKELHPLMCLLSMLPVSYVWVNG